jgi:hypothetical protein
MEHTSVGKWDSWYTDLPQVREGDLYGDATSYLLAAAFLADVELVEDWGCGKGGFRRFCLTETRGIDGSVTPYADSIADLCTYRSSAPGILIRHVLEHNYDWQKILFGAVNSFRDKLCLILFTPFADSTHELIHNRPSRIAVPDISFSRLDIEVHFSGLSWKLISLDRPNAIYGCEHIYFVWR